jgi:hypothetical protein
MEYCIVNTGEAMLDMLCASGLGIVLATATMDTVALHDEGIRWRIHCARPSRSRAVATVVQEVLALPSEEMLKDFLGAKREFDAMFANCDGLLAATYTSPGARVHSLRDLAIRSQSRPQLVTDSLTKVQRRIDKLLRPVETAKISATMADLETQYRTGVDTRPQVAAKASGEISTPMTFAPSFAYSTRQPCSDGLVARQTNLTLRNEPYRLLLGYVGAARFLRAQRVSGNFVNLYVPLPRRMTISPDTALPPLRSHTVSPTQALLAHWLSFGNTLRTTGIEWRGIAYQTLQTQAQQQSISVDQGVLSYEWLHKLQERAGEEIISKWQQAMVQEPKMLPWMLEQLIDVLQRRSGVAWIQHLRDVSLAALC